MTHPDELMKDLSVAAKEHGYGITEIELISLKSDCGSVPPTHRYSTNVVCSRSLHGDLVSEVKV